MKSVYFQGPGLAFSVLRRQVLAELIDLTYLLTELLCAGARSAIWHSSFPSCTSYNLAAKRLLKAGLMAYRRTGRRPPELQLTSAGQAQVSDAIFPERFWNRRWNGVWYLLMYDIPEKRRCYRSALRYFLARQRLGCLQKSVWISARDIRSLFHDLNEAASLHEYACLFAAQTVLGRPNTEVAAQAWNFEQLNDTQARYIETVRQRMLHSHAGRKPMSPLAVMRNELDEYVDAMRPDPLLPSVLWPSGYQGPLVARTFRQRMRQIALPWIRKHP